MAEKRKNIAQLYALVRGFIERVAWSKEPLDSRFLNAIADSVAEKSLEPGARIENEVNGICRDFVALSKRIAALDTMIQQRIEDAQ